MLSNHSWAVGLRAEVDPQDYASRLGYFWTGCIGAIPGMGPPHSEMDDYQASKRELNLEEYSHL